MNPEISKLLLDIEKSIEIIESHLKDITTFALYKEDLKTIDAIERRLSIIGEALWKADKQDPSLTIKHKKKIIALRHIIIHNYDLLDDAGIWMICKKNLPLLKTEVHQLLNH